MNMIFNKKTRKIRKALEEACNARVRAIVMKGSQGDLCFMCGLQKEGMCKFFHKPTLHPSPKRLKKCIKMFGYNRLEDFVKLSG